MRDDEREVQLFFVGSGRIFFVGSGHNYLDNLGKTRRSEQALYNFNGPMDGSVRWSNGWFNGWFDLRPHSKNTFKE